MVRLNLQVFAYTGNSIVDYLKSEGKDSSFNARKKIAESLGITNYTGTASQNTKMLNTLRSGSGSTSNNSKATTNTNNNKSNKNTAATPTNTSSNVKVNGVDQSLVDTMNSNFSQSNDVTNKYQEADKNYDNYKELANTTDIIDQSTWDALNTPFATSDAYKQAMQYTNELLEKLNSGKTSYTDQIKDLMSQILNREDFEYDVDKDTLFQQALASAMGSGKSAMQDTIGQASALTGGYGSTYATSAGNQAYNAFIEDAYNNLPEYYNMALQAYQAEGQEMYQQLDMLNAADATEWGRTYDTWQSNFANAQQMYNQEYGAWQDSITNAYNNANLQLSEHNQLVTDAYNLYVTSKDSADTLYAQEYQKWQDQVNQAMSLAGMQQTDYWNQTELDYKKDRDTVADQQWQQTFDFNKDQAAIAQSNWEKEYNLSLASNNAKVDDKGNVTVDYSGYINPDDVEVDENGDIVKIDGYTISGSADSKGNAPTVSGFRTTKGDNFEITIGKNTYKVENEGKVTSSKTKESIKNGKTYGNITIADNGNAYIKQGNDYYRIGNTNGLFNIGVSKNSGYNDLLLALAK